MTKDLFELSELLPGLTVSVKLSDLLQANRQLLSETIDTISSAVGSKDSSATPSYITREQMMSDFGISATTLWRWDKAGYLIPCKLGTKVLYKTEDVLKVMEVKRRRNSDENR